MKRVLILLMVLILITACSPITEKNATDGDSTDGENGEGSSDVLEPVAIGIEATIDEASSKASIHYFLDDNDDTFEVTGTDKDLIIWEIAKKYDISLNKVRRTIAFNGEKYTSDIWEETADDIVPSESGAYDEDSDVQQAIESGEGSLWFDAKMNDAQDYAIVYTYKGDKLIEQFRVEWADKDVVIVDVKNKYGLTMTETKASIKFDGEWYVSRSSSALIKFNTEPESEEMRALAANLTYISEKDEGYIRGVTCDLNNSLIKINFTNIADDTRLLFAERKPQVPSSLRFVLNGKTIYNLDCGRDTAENNSIEPGEFQECIKSNVYFINSRADFYTNKQDRLYVTSLGIYEYIEFECK